MWVVGKKKVKNLANGGTVVKNPFGFVQIIYFQLWDINKSYSQVLTPFNNFQLLLKLPIQT